MLLRPEAPPILSTPLPPLSLPLPVGSAGVRAIVDPSVAAFDSSSEPTDTACSLEMENRIVYFKHKQSNERQTKTHLLKLAAPTADAFNALKLCRARLPAP